MSFRLMPFIIVACIAMLAFKLTDYISGKKNFDSIIFPSLKAEQIEKKDEEKPEEKAKTENKEDKAEPAKEEKAEEKSEDKKNEKPRDLKTEKTFSQTELEILRRLSERRDTLEKREKEIEEKEKILALTEQNINKKIEELNALKLQVETIINQYNEKEDAKINSLVKIYENMKPKAAAPIFEQMDMNTLLTVINKMKEVKVAPILAQMNPEKARVVTEEFAKQKKLQ